MPESIWGCRGLVYVHLCPLPWLPRPVLSRGLATSSQCSQPSSDTSTLHPGGASAPCPSCSLCLPLRRRESVVLPLSAHLPWKTVLHRAESGFNPCVMSFSAWHRAGEAESPLLIQWRNKRMNADEGTIVFLSNVHLMTWFSFMWFRASFNFLLNM